MQCQLAASVPVLPQYYVRQIRSLSIAGTGFSHLGSRAGAAAGPGQGQQGKYRPRGR